jgi:CxxC-x17-CxxC domain-containing protein
MDIQFVDRLLTCSDCHGEFIFTAGAQLFFHDKQFKNDPKRCKPCKSRRSGLAAAANGLTGPAAAGLSRTETRTQCSECGVETTVPFKPTQGRPVLCRQCFQLKNRAAAAQTVAATPSAIAAEPQPILSAVGTPTAAALTQVSQANGEQLSPDAATVAAASMASASSASSVSSAADLASIAAPVPNETAVQANIPAQLLNVDHPAERVALSAEQSDA